MSQRVVACGLRPAGPWSDHSRAGRRQRRLNRFRFLVSRDRSARASLERSDSSVCGARGVEGCGWKVRDVVRRHRRARRGT